MTFKTDESARWGPGAPLQSLPYDSLGMDAESLKRAILGHLEYTLAELPQHVDSEWEPYVALALAVRDRMIERWVRTQDTYYEQDAKRVYYLSLEYLMGRTLGNSLVNLGLLDECAKALHELGYRLEDAARGRVGRRPRQRRPRPAGRVLPRLAGHAGLPVLRLRHPLRLRHLPPAHRQRRAGRGARRLAALRQSVGDPAPGRPVPRAVLRPGRRLHRRRRAGWSTSGWTPSDVLATPYDTPIPGYGTQTVNTLRLWAAQGGPASSTSASSTRATTSAPIEARARSENISRVLYPNDNVAAGKELRLAQEYFFVSATLQDIIRRYKKRYRDVRRAAGASDVFDRFAEKVAIQLNDTHPALAIPELMRILVDLEGLGWDEAWDITTGHLRLHEPHRAARGAGAVAGEPDRRACCPATCRSSTRSTPLPRRGARAASPATTTRCRRMSIIEEDGEQRVRMAHLAIVGQPQRQRRGGAAHRDPQDASVFRDFHEMWPEKFNNKTNGITPRRWLLKSNPPLSRLITERHRRRLGDRPGRAAAARRPGRRPRLRRGLADGQARATSSGSPRSSCGSTSAAASALTVDPDSLFDVQVKRIHEYKRQLLNVLHVITLYNRIKDRPDGDHAPAHRHLRRQGGARLLHGQADHPAHQRGRPTS